MSEPVTNIEIEDVLSSIRRLVSEESRIEPRTRAVQATAESGRLVLAPSFRVSGDLDATPAPTEEPTGEPESTGDSSDITDAEMPDIWQSGDAAETTESDGEDDRPWRDPAATLFEAAQVVDTRSADPEFLDLKDEDPQVHMPLFVGHSHEPDADRAKDDVPQADDTSDTIYQDEDRDSDRSDGAEIVGGDAPENFEALELPGDEQSQREQTDQHSDDMSDEAAAPLALGEHEIYLDPAQAPEQPEDVVVSEAAQTVADPEFDPLVDGMADTLSVKIQALEAAIGQTQDQWEPDGVGGDDYAGTRVETIEWRDHQEGENAGKTGLDAEPSAPDEQDTLDADDPADLFSEDEAFLDEESLRELVTDIVRQELQGALGERITRNVRKLVRREIHRALTAQELE